MSAAPTNQLSGLVDHADVQDWVARFNDALANSKTLTAPAPAEARPWYAPFFGCFMPVDTCAITCCAPCVTFGKTYHRSRKDGALVGYNCVNASCLMFLGFICVGLPFVPMMLQRADVRRKYNLQGDWVGDLVGACCCGCCSLVQMDKEVGYWEGRVREEGQRGGDGIRNAEGGGLGDGNEDGSAGEGGYKAQEGMEYEKN